TENVKVVLTADPATCGTLFDPVGVRTFTSPCDVARRTLANNSIHYDLASGPAGSPMTAKVNGTDAATSDNNGNAVVAAAHAADRFRDRCGKRQHFPGPLVSDCRGIDDVRHRPDLRAGDERPGHLRPRLSSARRGGAPERALRLSDWRRLLHRGRRFFFQEC